MAILGGLIMSDPGRELSRSSSGLMAGPMVSDPDEEFSTSMPGL